MHLRMKIAVLCGLVLATAGLTTGVSGTSYASMYTTAVKASSTDQADGNAP